MAETEPSPNPDLLSMLGRDITPELADALLDNQRQQDLFFRQGIAGWEALRERPNVEYFLAATAHELAPYDPVLREQVTCALIATAIMFNTAISVERTEDSQNVEEFINVIPVQRQLATGDSEAA